MNKLDEIEAGVLGLNERVNDLESSLKRLEIVIGELQYELYALKVEMDRYKYSHGEEVI